MAIPVLPSKYVPKKKMLGFFVEMEMLSVCAFTVISCTDSEPVTCFVYVVSGRVIFMSASDLDINKTIVLSQESKWRNFLEPLNLDFELFVEIQYEPDKVMFAVELVISLSVHPLHCRFMERRKPGVALCIGEKPIPQPPYLSCNSSRSISLR